MTVRPRNGGACLVIAGYHDLDVVEPFAQVLEIITAPNGNGDAS